MAVSLTSKPRNLREIMTTPVLPNREWIGHGYLVKGGKTIIGSSSKAGKSFVAMQLAYDLLRGGCAYDHPDLPILGEPTVLYCDQEIGPESTKGRLQAVFHGLDWEKVGENRFWTISREPALKLDTYVGVALMRALIEEKKPNIVILDPLAKFLEGDENNNTDVGRFVANLDAMLKEFAELDLSFVLLHHTGKIPNNLKERKATDFLNQYALRGASKFGDDVDCVHMMQRREPLYPSGWVNRCQMTFRHATDIPNFNLIVNYLKLGATYQAWVEDPE
jgi:RecA-family ATPase